MVVVKNGIVVTFGMTNSRKEQYHLQTFDFVVAFVVGKVVVTPNRNRRAQLGWKNSKHFGCLTL